MSNRERDSPPARGPPAGGQANGGGRRHRPQPAEPRLGLERGGLGRLTSDPAGAPAAGPVSFQQLVLVEILREGEDLRGAVGALDPPSQAVRHGPSLSTKRITELVFLEGYGHGRCPKVGRPQLPSSPPPPSWRLRTLPVALRGSSSRSSTSRGTL